MEQKPPKTRATKDSATSAGKAARLKAALRANLARRKAQARARKAADDKG